MTKYTHYLYAKKGKDIIVEFNSSNSIEEEIDFILQPGSKFSFQNYLNLMLLANDELVATFDIKRNGLINKK